MIPILDNSERARRVVLFFWVLLGTYVLLIFSSLLLLTVGVENVEDNGRSAVVAMQFGLAYFLVFGVYLAVVITYIQWFRRAYHNLKKAGHQLEMSEGWAAGSWFVPFANLVMPYRIMKEIWYKTQVEFTETPRHHGIVRIWWLAFIGGNIASQVLSKIADDDDLNQAALFAIISCVFHITGILLAIWVVKRVTLFEELFRQQLQIETVGVAQPIAKDNDAEEEFY